jgi:hypothetical protein
MNTRHLLGLLAALPLALLSACGGGSSDGNDANVRLVNASAGYASLDLYVDEAKEISAVTFGSGSAYTNVKSGGVEKVFTSAGSTTELLSKADNFGASKKYTIVAFGWEGALKSVNFTDDESAAASGKTKVGVYNAATGAGSLDIYLTGEDESLESSEPVHTGVAESSSSGSGYVSVTSGTYRLRVTAVGDTDKVLLDTSNVTLASTDVLTFITTPGSGGVLVNAIGIVQGGSVTPFMNSYARVRVVPAVAGGGQVTMIAGATSVASSAQSPSIGLYTLVPSGTMTLQTSVNGTSLADQSVTLAAGADVTVLVTGTSVGSATVNVMADDNRLPTTPSRYKLRLVHAAPSLADKTLSMSVAFSTVTTGLAFGSSSAFSTLTSGSNQQLDVSAPGTGTFYSNPNVTFAANAVYTLFIFDQDAGPVGVLNNAR